MNKTLRSSRAVMQLLEDLERDGNSLGNLEHLGLLAGDRYLQNLLREVFGEMIHDAVRDATRARLPELIRRELADGIRRGRYEIETNGRNRQ